jgi:putative flippase GtrA
MRQTDPATRLPALLNPASGTEPKRGVRLVLHYAAFAILATIANLGIQHLVLSIDDGMLFYYAALIGGTGVGLVMKYLLDKFWIFADPGQDLVTNAQQFSLYTLMGVVTTLIFWVVETGFWFVWGTHEARVAGAVLGLAIGYFVKYQLDRRFVFTRSSDAALAPVAVAVTPPN